MNDWIIDTETRFQGAKIAEHIYKESKAFYESLKNLLSEISSHEMTIEELEEEFEEYKPYIRLASFKEPEFPSFNEVWKKIEQFSLVKKQADQTYTITQLGRAVLISKKVIKF